MGFLKCLVYKNIKQGKRWVARNVDIQGFVKKCLVMHKIELDGWGSMSNVTLKSTSKTHVKSVIGIQLIELKEWLGYKEIG